MSKFKKYKKYDITFKKSINIEMKAKSIFSKIYLFSDLLGEELMNIGGLEEAKIS